MAITKPLGAYMANVFRGERTFLSGTLAPIERAIYRACGIDPEIEQTWTTYAAATLLFGLVNFALFYALLRFQGSLPLNPNGLGTARAPAGSVPITPDLNGSAFAGLNANSPWFNATLGLEMLIGRFLVIIPALAIAGSLARKHRLAVTGGTMPTHGPLFAALLLGTIVLVTALTFFPALSLGPIAEHYWMHLGTTVR